MARDRFALRGRQKSGSLVKVSGRPNRRLILEALEDRSLMAALAGGLDQETPLNEAAAFYASAGSQLTGSAVTGTSFTSAAPAAARSGRTAAIVDDRFEENDS